MAENAEPVEYGKTVLRPRRPGENLKIAETVLKRRDRNLQAAAERAQSIARARAETKAEMKRAKILSAEKFVHSARLKYKDSRRVMNMHKKPLPKLEKKKDGGHVLAVIRNARKGGSKRVKAALRSLRLVRRERLVFLQNQKEVAENLRLVKPFVYWGCPTFKTVYNLVHKRACFRDTTAEKGKEGVMLSDNMIIEKSLGDLGVLCTEDLAETVFSGSEHFEAVTQRLFPFRVGDLRKAQGLVHDTFHTHGDVRGEINNHIEKLLGE